MKNYLLIGSTISASMFLFGCKKQIVEPIEIQSTSSIAVNPTSQCRAATLGVYSVYPSSPANGEWTTLAQKWYANDGKVKYLKAKHGGWTGTFLDPILDLMFDLNWGEVLYQGNQVYLKDVVNNRVMMRVTVDNHGRPLASYYDYEPSPGTYMHDTTYYYYDDNRLESIISLYERTTFGPIPYVGWRKFVFSYDDWGNLVKAEFPGNNRLNVQYDYTKPVEGIISNFHVTSPLKLLEYMELIKLPMHHAVIRTNFEVASYYNVPYEVYNEVRNSQYKDYVITNGLVRSYAYDDPFRVITFYNGWECAPAPSVIGTVLPENAVSNLKQFKQMYPNQR